MHDGQIASEGVDSISVIALPRISLIKGERNRSQELRKKVEKNVCCLLYLFEER